MRTQTFDKKTVKKNIKNLKKRSLNNSVVEILPFLVKDIKLA